MKRVAPAESPPKPMSSGLGEAQGWRSAIEELDESLCRERPPARLLRCPLLFFGPLDLNGLYGER